MASGATDRNRLNFLSGFKNSPQGAYEDPTYLGFKILFDIDGALKIGPDDGLPPSPLFKDNAYSFEDGGAFASNNPYGLPEYRSTNVSFHSAQSYLVQREDGYNNGFGGKRADALNQFKALLRQINNESPWFFQNISGLNELTKVTKPGYNGGGGEGEIFNPHRTGGKFLTINCLESINLRVSTLAELYRQATFDFEYMREVVPRNLRKFKMFIYVSEIRNFNKTDRLSNVSTAVRSLAGTSNLVGNGLNPGNSLGGPLAGGGGLPFANQNSLVSNILNRSGIANDVAGLTNFFNQTDQSGIVPYLIFECSQCEFDFDSTTPIKADLDNGAGNAVAETASFKIYVDKVKTKVQIPNIRDDGYPLILRDSYDQNSSDVKKVDRSQDLNNNLNGLVNNLLQKGQNTLTNFVGNSINNYVNTQVSRLNQLLSGADQALLGNVYSFNPGNLINLPNTDNLADLAAQFQNGLDLRGVIGRSAQLPNPQSNGFGGPPERVYNAPSGDAYSQVPGADLGVPDRIYPAPSGDVYPGVPGGDLGVPDRIYPTFESDIYENVPGQDLGVPDRIYPVPTGDFYPDSPGQSLGVPDRVYTKPEGDVYETVPGNDLGVPDRIYAAPKEDVYPNVPGRDLGVPDRRYTLDNTDVYPTSPGNDLGVPDRNYSFDQTRIYPEEIPSSRQDQFGRIYEDNIDINGKPSGRVYPEQSRFTTDQRFVENLYGPGIPSSDSKNLGQIYPPNLSDFQPEIQSLGNLKPADRYNFSLDDFNGIDED